MTDVAVTATAQTVASGPGRWRFTHAGGSANVLLQGPGGQTQILQPGGQPLEAVAAAGQSWSAATSAGSATLAVVLSRPLAPGVIAPNSAGALVVGDGVTDLDSLTPAGSGSYAGLTNTHLLPGRRWAFWGDSVFNGSSASNPVYAAPAQAIAMAGASARQDYVNAATSGYTAGKVLAYIPTVLASYPTINGSVLMVGINDSSGILGLAVYAAAVEAAVALLKPKGPVVLCTAPPKAGAAATAPARQALLAQNMWLRIRGPELGCEIADVFYALADPATGDYLAAYDSGDGTHPNNLGHMMMAQVIAKAMLRAMGSTRPSVSPGALMTGQSIVANPLMGTGVGAGLPTSWFENPGGTGTAPTYSKIADTTGILPAGLWAQMDFDGTAAGGVRNFATSPAALGGVVGDTLAWVGTTLIEDLSGTWLADVVAGTATANTSLRRQDAAGLLDVTLRTPGLNIGNALGTGNTVYQIGPMLMPYTLLAGTTGLLVYNYVQVPTGKHIKVRYGAMDLINLTTLGLTTYAGGVSGAVVNLDGP